MEGRCHSCRGILWYMKVYCQVNYKYNCTTFAILLGEGWGGLGVERGILFPEAFTFFSRDDGIATDSVT